MTKLPLTAEEQEKFDADMQAHAAKLMAAARPDPPAPDGFAHWPTTPHGVGDALSPHLVGVGTSQTIAERDAEMKERLIEQESNPLVIRL